LSNAKSFLGSKLLAKFPILVDSTQNKRYNVYRDEVPKMGRTNVVLNDDLVTKAKNLTGIKTIRQLIDYALQELVRHKRQKEFLKLQGKIDWQGDLEKLRESRQF